MASTLDMFTGDFIGYIQGYQAQGSEYSSDWWVTYMVIMMYELAVLLVIANFFTGWT